MKIVLMVVDTGHAEDIERLLEECEAPGYTEIPNVHGKGGSGKKSGTRAFPGSSSLYVAALDDQCVEPLRARLADVRAARGPGPGIKAFVLNTEEL